MALYPRGCCVLMAALLCAPVALRAQAEDAAYACLRNDYLEQPATMPGFERRALVQYSAEQTACSITASELSNKGWRVLDVRNSTANAQSPLEGALALSLAEIKDKPYLRSQPLLLVGSGVDLYPLTQECVRLRQLGFENVRVLLGGAKNWRRKTPLDPIPPQELWLGAGQGVWRIVSLGLTPAQVAVLPQPPAVQLPLNSSAQELRQAMAKSVRSSPMARTEQWLVVAVDDIKAQASMIALQQYQPPTPKASSNAIEPIAWLVGGWSAYQTYIAEQKSVAAHAGRTLTRRCGS